nr:winged helix-turn-helix transcriptional regulator [Streptomyces sp. AC512_CC834]
MGHDDAQPAGRTGRTRKVLILWALREHPRRRFGELRRLLPGITEKVLAAWGRERPATRGLKEKAG